MFHPVGPRAPAVYWRRRIVALGAALLLVALSVALLGRGTGNAAAGAGPDAAPPTPSIDLAPALPTVVPGGVRTAAGTTRPVATTHPAGTTGRAGPTGAAATTGAAGPAGASHSAAPTACTTAQLQVSAAVAQSAYRVGDTPIVMLQVSNRGPAPCVQDLADRQVELRIYNGESRVWGSHDCQVQPGTDPRTVAVGQTVRVSMIWSGLSSQPGCAGTRERVGAGTYTLYPLLSGRLGAAAQFSIS